MQIVGMLALAPGVKEIFSARSNTIHMHKSEISIDNEQILLKEVSLGNIEAYSRLYSRYVPKLYRFIFPFAKQSKEDTEEVIQDVFLKIWVRRETLVGLKSFEAYLFRMAKNQLIDLHQRSQVSQKMTTQLTLVKTESVYDDFVYDDYYKAALDAMNQLTPQRRKIFEMRTQQDMAIDEIASSLDISRSAVKKQLYEAINFIKHHLKKHADWPLLILWVFLD